MEGKLKIATYNCQGMKSSMQHISELLAEVHILALQETWLYSDELQVPDTLHRDYNSFSVSAVDESRELRRGRPYGGLTFLWRKSLSKNIRVHTSHDPRILGLTYRDDRFSVLLLNVYLPTNRAENREEQLEYLGKLASIIDDVQVANVCVWWGTSMLPRAHSISTTYSICVRSGT